MFAIVYLLLRSRHGLALTAIRNSEPASASLGVNTFRTKFIIYIATAACTGLIGALIFLQKLRISPEAGFSINDWTVVVIFMVVIGGIGTIEGPFIGMLIYIVLRELLADYGTYYLILLGADRDRDHAQGAVGTLGLGHPALRFAALPGRPPAGADAAGGCREALGESECTDRQSPRSARRGRKFWRVCRRLSARFAERAAAAEEARRISPEVRRRICSMPVSPASSYRERIGGYGLGFEEWFDVTRELSKADASHGWCAGLIIHHAHLMAQFPEAAQKALWAKGLDVPVAASFAPAVKAVPVDGGYRISGAGSPFASGVDHCTWVMLGGMAHDDADPEWKFFLVPQAEYTVRDTWFTAGMRATGSKTIVTDHVFVPHGLVLRLSDLRDGKSPGGAVHPGVIFHTPFFYYAPISFVDADDRRGARRL